MLCYHELYAGMCWILWCCIGVGYELLCCLLMFSSLNVYLGPLKDTAEDYKYVCTFVDYFTKFPQFFPLKNKFACGIAQCIRSFIHRYSEMKIILLC